jgi:hypothetical protein
MAHRGRSLHVSEEFELGPDTRLNSRDSRLRPTGGNFSRLLTTSGVSSADVGPTGGRYGSVWLRHLALNLLTGRPFGRYIHSRASPPS